MHSKKYVKKNRKEDEKKMISARVKVTTLNAFNNASRDASKNGYSISMTDVIEGALKEAILEYKYISGKDFLAFERQKIVEEWEEEWAKEQERDMKRFEEESFKQMAADYEEMYKIEEKMTESHIEAQIQARIDRDSRALLTMSDDELNKYRKKRKLEEKEREAKHAELIERIRERLAERK